jgi:hypothetical protein
MYCHSPARISGQVSRVQTGKRDVMSGVRSTGSRLCIDENVASGLVRVVSEPKRVCELAGGVRISTVGGQARMAQTTSHELPEHGAWWSLPSRGGEHSPNRYPSQYPSCPFCQWQTMPVTVRFGQCRVGRV